MLPFCKPPPGKRKKARTKPSIRQDTTGIDEPIPLQRPVYQCWVCETTWNLELHHVFYGAANRSISDKYNMTVYLCKDHHTGSRGVHMDRELNIKLKKAFQHNFEFLNGHECFMRLIKKNYLCEVIEVDISDRPRDNGIGVCAVGRKSKAG